MIGPWQAPANDGGLTMGPGFNCAGPWVLVFTGVAAPVGDAELATVPLPSHVGERVEHRLGPAAASFHPNAMFTPEHEVAVDDPI